MLDAHSQRSAARQEQNRRETGFAGERADLAHAVVWELRKRRYSPSVAWFAGQLVSAGGTWNFQGNTRLAKWGGFSERTAQRARAILEADKLITSYLLEAGQQVPGQRSPVRRPQVVRDVRPLLGLVPRGLVRRPRRSTSFDGRGSRPSPDRSPQQDQRPLPSAFTNPPPTTAPTAELFTELAAKHPEFARYFVGMAAAKQPTQRPEIKPPPPAKIDPSEIDAWDEETERLEAPDLHDTERPPKPPPKRALH